jgi:hypothetical protein
MVVRCECCVLSGRGLCDGLITRPEESYRLWCVLVCELRTSRRRRLRLIKGCKCGKEEEEKVRKRRSYTTCTGPHSEYQDSDVSKTAQFPLGNELQWQS